MQRESPSTQMSNQLTRRDFAIRTAGFGLALGLAPAATLAEFEQASRSATSPAVADPYSLVDPELLPALKQFPTFDFSAELVGKFRQTPGMPPLPGQSFCLELAARCSSGLVQGAGRRRPGAG